jgi:hypothetical protein
MNTSVVLEADLFGLFFATHYQKGKYGRFP